eukprot:TRINITY_DN1254_c0_g1_i4.p2 TRINITY_DN1254_c0_g1~~TRINITY_DN1254_c0_g1_i4.p2  ORF type:complete len:628 (+),score=117.51 TRINITY_DN1254_c0_g1_i4:174-2057(+)
MCDLETYRCRIGTFCGKVKLTGGFWDNKVSEVGPTHDTCVSTCDIVLAFVSIALLAAVVSSFVSNVKRLCNHDIVTISENNIGGTVLCADSVLYATDGVCHGPSLVLAMHVPTVVAFACVVNKVLSMWRLRLSGDVEENPGPDPSSNQPGNGESADRKDKHVNISCDTDEFLAKLTTSIQQQINANTNLIREDLSGIKEELCAIKEQCKRIDDRCDTLEKDQRVLSDSVTALHEEVTEGRSGTDTLKTTVQELQEEIGHVRTEIDRLESFSRRDNLRFFGIPQIQHSENFDMCVAAVVETLNNIDGSRTWTADDFVRAHRVGQRREGQPRPMIARFSRWRDKMLVITNKHIRDNLRLKGIGVANDLTRQQASIAAQARREGKKAFFRNGVMVVGPARPDPRTYAEVTATVGADSAGVSSADRLHSRGGATTQQHVPGQGRLGEAVNRHEDSPRRDPLTPCAMKRGDDAGGGAHRDVRASPVNQRAENGGDGGDGEGSGSLRDAGGSLTGQSSRGTGGGDGAIPRRDGTCSPAGSLSGQPARDSGRGDGASPQLQVRGRPSGSLIGTPTHGAGRGDGVSPRHDAAGNPRGTRGGRQGSAGRQPGLRGYLRNQCGNSGDQRSLRNKKSK